MTITSKTPLPGDRLTLRPIWFADTPVDLADGSCRRLAGGLIWFQGVEARWANSEAVIGKATLPVALLDDWIAKLPDDLSAKARAQAENLTSLRAPLTMGDRVLRFEAPQVMGVLNMTPDSFSDGGRHLDDVEAAADAGFAMQLAGAAIVDVGGESTRPGATTVWEGDEIARVTPVIERLAKAGVIVSIDTRKAAVMEAALNAGAAIVNDISGLTHDPRALEVVAAAGCSVALMHAPSSGDDPHSRQAPYDDVCTDVFEWLESRIKACLAGGGRPR